MRYLCFVIALVIGVGSALVSELKASAVVPGIYALAGHSEARIYDNHGLNATFGFVVTPAGVVLIDSGASSQGAQVI